MSRRQLIRKKRGKSNGTIFEVKIPDYSSGSIFFGEHGLQDMIHSFEGKLKIVFIKKGGIFFNLLKLFDLSSSFCK